MDLKLLDKAKLGDIEARNLFIEMNKPFIHKYACLVCKRYLSWENDDELSISLMAFNSAIDSFVEGNFEAYSKSVIKNRLIDYFRKNSKHEIPIDDDIIENYTHYTHKIDEKLDRAAQINLLKSILSQFNITFEDLTKRSPKHKDTREKLICLAKLISTEENIVETIYKQKILPIKDIMNLSDTSRKVLEEWRKYLIALIIIFTDKRLDSIKDFIV
jgi:RNA polymerase sigma factor